LWVGKRSSSLKIYGEGREISPQQGGNQIGFLSAEVNKNEVILKRKSSNIPFAL
jgi:hypothetical protein